MSNKAAKETAVQSTKQMLDELDVLMEQMLSLPVSDPDDAPEFPRNLVKPHALTATLTMLQPPGEEANEHPRLNAPHLPLPMPLTNDAVPASLLTQVEPLLAEIPPSEAAATTLWIYLPLVWINQAFDGVTQLMGGFGSALRTHASRMLLGLAGVAMLSISVGWLLKDWLGWKW